MEYLEFNLKATKSSSIKNSSDKLHNLVIDYKKGLPGSSEALIEAFGPIIGKYYRLLTLGIWDSQDSDVIKFLSMLGKSDKEQTSEWLVRALSCYERCEIYHELVLILLLTAKKYMNIAYNFRYVAKQRILELIHDPITYYNLAQTDCLLTEIWSTDREEINSSWVNGLSVGEGFEKLTSLERAVIKYVYNDGLSEIVAAEKLNMSVRQLRRYKRRAKDTLANYFGIEDKKCPKKVKSSR